VPGLRPLEIIWSAAVTLDVTDDPTLVRDMALAGCTGVFVGLETLNNENIAAAERNRLRSKTTLGGSASSMTAGSR